MPEVELMGHNPYLSQINGLTEAESADHFPLMKPLTDKTDLSNQGDLKWYLERLIWENGVAI